MRSDTGRDGIVASGTPPPRDYIVISQPEQLRALAHPERLQILKMLARESMTGAQVAHALGLPANRVHYHMRGLLQHGLVRESHRGRKRWKAERYFVATARHHLVDPGLGVDDVETSGEILDAARSTLQDRRLRETLHIDLRQFAQRLVRQCARIRPRERVLLIIPPKMKWNVELVGEVEAAGAQGTLKYISDSLLLRTEEPAETTGRQPFDFIDPALDQSIDAVICVSPVLGDGEGWTPEQRSKLRVALDHFTSWRQSLRQRGVRTLEVVHLDPGVLETAIAAPDEVVDHFWQLLDVDYLQLAERLEDSLRYLHSDSEWRIGAGEDGVLTLQIDRDRTEVQGGRLGDPDLPGDAFVARLPAGLIIARPLDGRARGVIAGDYAYLDGRRARRVRLGVEQGRIVWMESVEEEGSEAGVGFSTEVLAPFRLASVSVGTNPVEVQEICGFPCLDACLSGNLVFTFVDGVAADEDAAAAPGDRNIERSLRVVVPNADLSIGGAKVLQRGVWPED